MPNKTEHYAYGPDRAEVEAIMRFSAVKRWHMIETTGVQTLADHSGCVAALVYLVAWKSPQVFFGSPAGAMAAALFHDIPEVFTGDFPSHSKQWLNRGDLELMESSVTPEAFKHPDRDADPNVQLLIKLCDLADGIRFIRNRAVDMTGQHALQGLEAQLAIKWREAAAAWPPVVYSRAADIIEFYAYETRKHPAGENLPSSQGQMENDLARGSGNQSRGAGSELRDDMANASWLRDRVD